MSSTKSHKDWHSRGYVPHFDKQDLIQSITFRLVDSLPKHLVDSLKEAKDVSADPEKRRRTESYLDAGYGECLLENSEIANLVQDALLYFNNERYRLLAWVIMPNHLHVIIRVFDGHPLDQVVHSWKSFTAFKANTILGREGRFWYPDYFDRYIRDEKHLENAVEYIENNPVKAGLVSDARAWPYSSLSYKGKA
jgi:REP element-mobilizing transposase RayT